MRETKNIIIIGAGFAGITAALKLERKLRKNREYRLMVIDKNSYQLYTPALYEIASIRSQNTPMSAVKESICIPLADIFRNKNAAFIQKELSGLDIRAKTVLMTDGTALPYEFLILALGAETNYFNIPGLREYSHPLKKFADAVRIHQAIEHLASQKDDLHIVVGGGGASGVELIAEFSNFLCSLKKYDPGRYNRCASTLTLVEAASDILPGFSNWIVNLAKKRLLEIGVNTKTGNPIKAVTESEVLLKDNSGIAYDIFIWTGGVTGPAVLQKLGLPLTPKNNLEIDAYLKVNNNIYAVGDNAGFLDPETGRELLWNVPVAESEARFVAKDIMREIRKYKKIPYRPGKKYPYILALGEKFAIADLLVIKFSGFLGWFAKLLAELRYLLFILPPAKALKTWIRAARIYSAND